MHRFTTYCDLAFLDQYARIKPDKDVADWTEEEDQWKKVLDFLRKDSDVIVNMPEEDLSPAQLERHPVLHRLLNGRLAGSRISFDPDAFSGLEEKAFHEAKRPWRVFLLGKTITPPAQLSAAYGALFLDASEVLQTWARIGRPAMLNVSDRRDVPRFSWKDLERFAAPLTSLLVCDPYLLKDKSGQALENVAPLVVSLLPKGQNQVPVEIMLVTMEVVGRLEDLHSKLEGYIRKHRRTLAFSLSLVASKRMKVYHDRHVFMNYGFVKSGTSFKDYFKKGKPNANTTIGFEPVVDFDRLQVVTNKLRELARMVEDAPEEDPQGRRNVVGSKENALLRAAQQSAGAGTNA